MSLITTCREELEREGTALPLEGLTRSPSCTPLVARLRKSTRPPSRNPCSVEMSQTPLNSSRAHHPCPPCHLPLRGRPPQGYIRGGRKNRCQRLLPFLVGVRAESCLGVRTWISRTGYRDRTSIRTPCKREVETRAALAAVREGPLPWEQLPGWPAGVGVGGVALPTAVLCTWNSARCRDNCGVRVARVATRSFPRIRNRDILIRPHDACPISRVWPETRARLTCTTLVPTAATGPVPTRPPLRISPPPTRSTATSLGWGCRTGV